jgi:tryptophan synthase alpha chain
MNRIDSKFEELRANGSKGFIPFVTAGDPDLETSLSIILKLAELGADVIELGVPFSDPMADGPTIQRSSDRALKGGSTLGGVIELVARFRRSSDVPVVVFSYFNPVMRFGIDEFCIQAAEAGVDGLLLTDVIEGEAAEISERLKSSGMGLISLVAPTTTDARLEKICSHARGFIYAVSRAGVTGARSEPSTAAEDLVDRTRRFTNLPIAVGFGVSTREQVAEVWGYADAAVVGSAIVSEIEKHPGQEVEAVERFVKQLLP